MAASRLSRTIKAVIAFLLQRRIVRAFLRYSEHRGGALADSITYRALFSLFAGVLLGFSFAALWFGNNPDALNTLSETLDAVVPGLMNVIDPSQISAPTGFTIAGIVSLLGLIGAAFGTVTSLRLGIRTLADEVHDDGFFLWVLLRNLLVAISFGGLLVIAAALSVIGSVGITTVAEWFGISLGSEIGGWITRLLGISIVFAIDTVAIVLMFALLSGVKAPPRALWGGALLGALGLIVLQELSGLFIGGATANPLFGAFAVLIALLLWVNLSAQVILIASSYIITATVEHHDRVREKFGASTLVQHRRKRAEDRVAVAARELRAARKAEREEAAKSTPMTEGAESPSVETGNTEQTKR